MKTKLLVVVLMLLAQYQLFAQSLKLWYNKPASYFEESLVLGNGKMGASVFGGVQSDMIYLNDATLWSGEPVNANMNPEAYKNLAAVREALKNEDYRLADQLNKKLQGKFSESYAPLGTMTINLHHQGEPSNYYRELNIGDAISKVTYQINGVTYTREYFISYPDKVMMIKLTASQKGALSFDLKFDSQLKYKVAVNGDALQATGYAPYHTEPSYRGDRPDAVLYDENRGTRFTTLYKVKHADGQVVVNSGALSFKNGTEAIVYVSVATSFNGFDKNPATEGLDHAALASQQLDAAFGKTYKQIRKSHLVDYHQYYNRVVLNLGKVAEPNLPTDERLKLYANGNDDKNFEILYFQYGRYLLIASSRTPGVPANLQGIWNPYVRPPWSSNYTTNINAEENYWLAENCNLSELHRPLMDLIQNISKTGAVTAKTFYGCGGWVACHNSDIWAMSNPVGDFGTGDPNWANWNMGGTWLSTHLWEHFTFTQDVDFLKTQGYPLLKGAAQFCLDWLVEDRQGNLITSPCTSPENIYVTPDGYRGATYYGGTADLAMIRECFRQTIEASKRLNVDADFRATVEAALARLHPYQVGSKGQLQEWYYDWEDAEPQHRHQSHLFGLFPGHSISPLSTPDLAKACERTLEIRGDETTGWSKGWRINLWARLGDGNHAYKMIRELLKYVEPDGKATNYQRGGGTYPNLFDAHPPFQIDGNFGGAAAFVEMLVQSSETEIQLLPALPDAWKDGSVKGICARGGFVIDMSWANGKLTKAKIYSRAGEPCTVVYGGKTYQLNIAKGKSALLKL
jgi:alpha-L-fucosidase 2